MVTIREELISLLQENIEQEKYELYIWGTGNTAALYQQGLKRLEQEGIVVSGYVDNDQKKWGRKYADKVILPPLELKKIKNVLVLIASPQPGVINSVAKQLSEMEIDWMHIDAFIFRTHKEQVLKAFDLLEDEESRMVYKEILKCRINGTYPSEKVISKEQYFSFGNFGEYNPNEVYVDCGAYVGDSLERFIWAKDGVFRKIIAFEPDADNCKAMKKRVKRLREEWNLKEDKVEIFSCAVGRINKVLYVDRYENNNGFGSKMQEEQNCNMEGVDQIALDEFVKEPYTFLKADIESYEYDMILGAQKGIRKYSPKLAICIYHNAVDYYQIPLLIHTINPGYHFAVRHYTHILSESVLYAYTEER